MDINNVKLSELAEEEYTKMVFPESSNFDSNCRIVLNFRAIRRLGVLVTNELPLLFSFYSEKHCTGSDSNFEFKPQQFLFHFFCCPAFGFHILRGNYDHSADVENSLWVGIRD